MIEIVGVSLKEKGRIYYFLPGKLKLNKNVTVIVETEKGLQFGKVETNIIQMDESKIKFPLKSVIRISTKQDYYNHCQNLKDAKSALIKCKGLVEKQKLKMQVIDASFTFDRDQLIFRFVADNRIDFRDLAKELASIYRTRIELRQVGVRDKAREVGGCGQCGQTLCCSKFSEDFNSVSINMAKNQNISLNPTKINGVCGRLLCCLKYEDDNYFECRKCLPEIGASIKTEKGEGKVISIDVLNKTYRADVPNVGIIKVEVKNGCN